MSVKVRVWVGVLLHWCVCAFISFQEYMRYIVVHAYVEVCVRVSLCVCFILFIFAVLETGLRALFKAKE